VFSFTHQIQASLNGPLLNAPPSAVSAKRWRFHAFAGSALAPHRNGKTPPSHRLAPVDVTRYPPPVLRQIRASAVNFRGEIRR
jgi:hypothetical protein